MRKEIYGFLFLSAVCTGIEYWGVSTNLFSYSQAIVVALCFTVTAFFSLYNAINALPTHES